VIYILIVSEFGYIILIFLLGEVQGTALHGRPPSGGMVHRLTRHCRFGPRKANSWCWTSKSNHEADATTSIRQARRAKAHRRRQCQTLLAMRLLKVKLWACGHSGRIIY